MGQARSVLKKFIGCSNTHGKNVRNCLSVEMNSQRLAIILKPQAYFACYVHIRQKLHSYFYLAFSLARLTSSSFYVKGKSSRTVSFESRFLSLGKKRSDISKASRISCGIASWRSPNCRLIYKIDIFYKLISA